MYMCIHNDFICGTTFSDCIGIFKFLHNYLLSFWENRIMIYSDITHIYAFTSLFAIYRLPWRHSHILLSIKPTKNIVTWHFVIRPFLPTLGIFFYAIIRLATGVFVGQYNEETAWNGLQKNIFLKLLWINNHLPTSQKYFYIIHIIFI